jgi:hypothetical protein
MRQLFAVLGLVLVVLASSAQSQNKPKPWLLGVWEGTGYQADDGTTWTMSLKVTRRKGFGRMYTIDYPSLNCGGRWKLLSLNSNMAKFREQLSFGQDKCSNNGLVVFERQYSGEGIFLYRNEGARKITASAILYRKKKTQSQQ